MYGIGLLLNKFAFISYYPLKQGLKHIKFNDIAIAANPIYILLSIKTRIETWNRQRILLWTSGIYILLSIKTRIETTQSSCHSATGN